MHILAFICMTLINFNEGLFRPNFIRCLCKNIYFNYSIFLWTSRGHTHMEVKSIFLYGFFSTELLIPLVKIN